MNKGKIFLLMASMVLAVIFAFSCSSDDGGNERNFFAEIGKVCVAYDNSFPEPLDNKYFTKDGTANYNIMRSKCGNKSEYSLTGGTSTELKDWLNDFNISSAMRKRINQELFDNNNSAFLGFYPAVDDFLRYLYVKECNGCRPSQIEPGNSSARPSSSSSYGEPNDIASPDLNITDITFRWATPDQDEVEINVGARLITDDPAITGFDSVLVKLNGKTLNNDNKGKNQFTFSYNRMFDPLINVETELGLGVCGNDVILFVEVYAFGKRDVEASAARTLRKDGNIGNCRSSSSLAQSSSSFAHIGKGNDISNYRTVEIGTQTWMAENLDYVVEGSKCYENNPANCDIYGSLYNWATAMALPSSCNSTSCSSQVQSKHRGICPAGWHIPSDAEWTTLEDAAGGSSRAGKHLKSKSGWNSSRIENLDTYSFSALPGGGGGYSDGYFDYVGLNGIWWSASEYEYASDIAYRRYMRYNGEGAYWSISDKSLLFSVRCLQD